MVITDSHKLLFLCCGSRRRLW